MQSFGTVTSCKPTFLRRAYEHLTGDSLASRTVSVEGRDKRMAEMLEFQDPDLVADLRTNNSGQPERYDVFLEECRKYITEKVETAVDDRSVSEKCPDGTPIPSEQWLRLQFWPRRKNTVLAGIMVTSR